MWETKISDYTRKKKSTFPDSSATLVLPNSDDSLALSAFLATGFTPNRASFSSSSLNSRGGTSGTVSFFYQKKNKWHPQKQTNKTFAWRAWQCIEQARSTVLFKVLAKLWGRERQDRTVKGAQTGRSNTTTTSDLQTLSAITRSALVSLHLLTPCVCHGLDPNLCHPIISLSSLPPSPYLSAVWHHPEMSC